MMNIEHRVYPVALTTYGINAQIVVAIEEMAELTQVLTKGLRGDPVKLDNLFEEIADVQIMLNQLKFRFDGVGGVQKAMLKKLERLEARLDEVAEP